MPQQPEDTTPTVQAAVRWARSRSLTPWRFGELVNTGAASPVRYARLVTTWARREAAWNERPADSHARVTATPPVDLAAVSLSTTSTGDLATRSEHAATCSGCHGTKKADCATCAGSGRARCPSCAGSGQQRSTAKSHPGRLIQCKICRGAGTRKCDTCSAGKIECGRCAGSGKVVRVAEIRTTYRHHVGVWPRTPAADAHPGFFEATDAALGWKGAVTLETKREDGPIIPATLGEAARTLGVQTAWAQLQPPLDPKNDRLERQQLAIFEVPIAKVTFDVSGRRGFVVVAGTPPEPTDEFDDAPLRSWGTWTKTVLAVVGVAMITGALWFFVDPFRRSDPLAVLWLLAIGVASTGAIAATTTWRRRLLSDGTLRPGGLGLTGGLALLLFGLAGAAVAVTLARPSVTAAEAALKAERYEEAARQLDALDRSGRGHERTAELRDQFVLAQVRQLKNRDAVKALSAALATTGEPRPALSDERRRLRTAWTQTRLAAGAIDEALPEVVALEAENPNNQEVTALARSARQTALQSAGQAVDRKDYDRAVHLLTIPGASPGEAHDLLVRAYTESLAACASSDLRCKAGGLRHLAEVSGDPVDSTKLATFRRTTLERLDFVEPCTGRQAQVISKLSDATRDCAVLKEVLGPEPSVNEVCQRVQERLAAFQ